MFKKYFKLSVSSALIMSSVIVGTLIVGVPPASAVSGPAHELQLTNYPTYCVDVKGGNNVAGTQVWLTTCASGKSEEWLVNDNAFDNYFCYAISCFSIQDAAAPSLCISTPGGYSGGIYLEACDIEYSQWDILGNDQYLRSDSLDEYLTAESLTNDSPLFLTSEQVSYQYWTSSPFGST